MATKKKQDDLEQIVGKAEVEIKGEQIDVHPFRFGKLPKASAMIAKYAQYFDEQGIDWKTANLIEVLAPKLTEAGDDLMQIMEWCTDKDRSYLEDLELEDGLKLLGKVIEVNMSFFTERLAPMLAGLLDQVPDKRSDGESQSSDLSRTGTG